MVMTRNVVRTGNRITSVNGKGPPPHLAGLIVPPAWTDLEAELDSRKPCVLMGTDAAGRRQRMYSAEWTAAAKSSKFERVKALRAEWDDLRTQIESDVNNDSLTAKTREAARVALLIYETGIRPGHGIDEAAQVKAYGACTLQLRHVKRCSRGVRLQFVGKKGVRQNVLVTNPYLVELFLERKAATTTWSSRLFSVSASHLNVYFKTLGSGDYSAKDFRTARGTTLALEILGKRRRWPAAKSKRKAIINEALDAVAKHLGNTRVVSRNSYVDPEVLDGLLPK